MRISTAACGAGAFLFIASLASPVLARKHKPFVPSCKVRYTVAVEDDLGNVTQGLPEKEAKWAMKKMEKKYPDVCYAAPSPDVAVVFYIKETPAVYHGVRKETTRSESTTDIDATTDIDGDIDASGSTTGTARTTTTTSTPVPHDVGYPVCALSVETRDNAGTLKVRHRFQEAGLGVGNRGIAAVAGALSGEAPQARPEPCGRTVLQDALKWVHAGGLTNPLEGVAP